MSARVLAGIVVVVLVGWSAAARADSAVAARPAALSLSATHGDQLVRVITLSGDAAILAEAWTVEPIPLSTPQGELQDDGALSVAPKGTGTSRRVEVTLDLAKTEPGTYTGEVVVRGKAGVLVRVPVTVNVKSGPVWPIILLVLGVLLGAGLSWYRANRLERDQLVARIGLLRQRIGADVPPAFVEAIDERLRAARDQLAQKEWAKAKAEVTAAEAALAAFRAQPGEWLRQLAFAGALAAELRKLPAAGTDTHRDRVVDAIASAVDAAVLAGDVSAFAAKLADLRKHALAYVRVAQLLADLEDDPALAAKLPDWRKRIVALDVGTVDKLEAIEKEIIAAQKLPPDAAADLDVGGVRLPAPPEVHAAEIADGARARLRVGIATSAALLVGLAALAALGYHELYEAKPTFGGFWAHVSLLFWGLGAEVTRGSASAFLKQGGIPDAT